MKILVADDSKTYLMLLTAELKKLGHEVMAANSGHQALEFFAAQRPDLIILDVVMEDIDGFECAKKIREVSIDDWIPIIFLSASINDESITKGIDAGGDDYLVKPCSDVTLAAKIKAMQRISDMRQKLFEATQKLSALSSTDALTGISNRLQFDQMIKEKIAQAYKQKSKLALFFVDLDKFKTINDTLGHHAGDLVLKEVTRKLKICLRNEDFIARIGGDEFAIIIYNPISPTKSDHIALRIIESLSTPFQLLGNAVTISASIGIALYPKDGTDEITLMENADRAMYHAKELGRHNYQYFSKDFIKKSMRIVK